MSVTSEPTSALLRRLAAPVYVPIVSGTFGLAMLLPVLPLYLTETGLSLGVASIVLASVGVGAAAGGLPVGALLPRVGDRAVMIGSLLLVAVTTALLGVTSAALALVALRVATGAGNVGLRLSRQSHITRHVDPRARGRAMSTIGGSFRVSLFLGFLGEKTKTLLTGSKAVDTPAYFSGTSPVTGTSSSLSFFESYFHVPLLSPVHPAGALSAIWLEARAPVINKHSLPGS